MADNSTEKDTILINIMYTGDYTNKNIGHEIINMYKTDNEKNYLYISPYGYVTSTWDKRIKTILYARSAGKNKLEIIAKVEPEHQVAINMKEQPQITLSGSKDLKNLKEKWKDNVRKCDKEFIEFTKRLKEWETICREIIRNDNNISIEKLMKTLPEYNQCYKDLYKEEELYKNFECEYKTLWESSYDSWRNNYFKWLVPNTIEHLRQLQIIFQNNIKYNNKFLCDIFEGNYWDENAIYFGFTTKDIKKPEKRIFIKYDATDTSEDTIYTSKEITNKEVNYCFEHAKIKNQSCNYYLNNKRVKNFDLFEKEINKERWKDNSTDTLEKSPYNKQETTFITIMGKQNDELSYSNMLAYYLNDRNIFKKFAIDVLEHSEVNISNVFEIKREYSDIDLLIETDNHVYIIENKIKSGINGINYDPYNGTYSNQLIKYYKIVVNEDESLKTKIPHFYIFKPDYNEINEEKLKKSIKDSSLKYEEEIIDIWGKGIIDYSKIHKFFEDNVDDLSNRELAEQFIKALNIHSSPNENIIEKEMEYKFREAIKNARR